MSDETDLHETIQTVVKRAETLDRLADGSTSKRDLRDDLGVSRSTVYKAVRELEEQNLVEEDGGAIRLTLYGRLVVDLYRSFAETVEDTTRQRSLLSVLPRDAPVTTDLLVGADAVLADRPAPSRPLDVIEDVILSTDRAIGFAPVAFQRFASLFREQRLAGNLTFDVVMERQVVEYLWEQDPEQFGESVSSDCFTYRETTEELPFGLVVTEDDTPEVAVVFYDEEGRPVGTIRNDTPAAVEWGHDVFETYRERATLVTSDES